MTSAMYVIGAVLIVVMVGSLAVTAVSIRRILLPDWSHAPARLAEAIIGLTVLIVLSELLGTIDALRRWAVVPCSVVIALTAFLVFRRRNAGAGSDPLVSEASEPAVARPGRVPTVVAILAVTFAVIKCMKSSFDALHSGMRSFDTLWYHMPFAARFVQDASVTHLQYVGNAPTSFYPANGELIHAIGILLVQNDILSPVINVGWLGVALLAAWCIGRPSGVAPATTTAAAFVAFLPVMGGAEAGTAANDIAALALLLATVAILINAPRSRSALFVAALAAGLAVGTRLNLWAPVLALGAVVMIAAPRGDRSYAASRLVIGVGVGSAFWYARNLVEVGNPLPWFGVKIGGVLTLPSTTPPVDCGTTSVAHYANDPAFVKTYLVPQLHSALGARWWLVLFLAVAGVAAGLVSRRTPMARGLALVALVSGAAYLVTPATAGAEHASCFAFNTRFAVPALALSLIVLPLVLAQRRRGPLGTVLAFALALVVTIHVPLSPEPLLAAILLVSSVCAVALGVWRRLPRPALVAALASLAALLGIAGWRQQQIYLRNRYADSQLTQPIESVSAVLRRMTHARVAVSGFTENYPLYGRNLSNRVDYPASRVDARFFPYATCRSWLLALRDGRYDYVVTAQQGTSESTAAEWTRRYPGAIEVLASPPGTERYGQAWRWQLFRLRPVRHLDPDAACARNRAAGAAPTAALQPWLAVLAPNEADGSAD